MRDCAQFERRETSGSNVELAPKDIYAVIPSAAFKAKSENKLWLATLDGDLKESTKDAVHTVDSQLGFKPETNAQVVESKLNGSLHTIPMRHAGQDGHRDQELLGVKSQLDLLQGRFVSLQSMPRTASNVDAQQPTPTMAPPRVNVQPGVEPPGPDP